MKRFLALFLAVAIAFTFAACKQEATAYDLILVTDIGTIDDKSFNQGAYEGIVQYASEHPEIKYNYFRPNSQSKSDYDAAIDQAVEAGAKIVVTPGYLFENSIHTAQYKYPEVNFILIDGAPHNVIDAETNETYDQQEVDTTVLPNTYAVFFKEEQAGFLAGYAAVKDGYTKLGFMGGMAVPAVVRYGYGYVQGAEYAAKELGITGVTVKYHYTGGFSASPEIQTMASSWYGDGVEVIFACGGALCDSVFRAAENANAASIGVDVDQSNLSTTVITSAMKNITQTVYDAIDGYYNGVFPGGQSIYVGAAEQGIGLPMATSKFKTFTQADYDKIFNAIKNDTDGISSNIKKNEVTKVTDLPLTAVTVDEIL